LRHLFASYSTLERAFWEEAQGTKYGLTFEDGPLRGEQLHETSKHRAKGKSNSEGAEATMGKIEPIEVVDTRMRRMAAGHAAQLRYEAERARNEKQEPLSLYASVGKEVRAIPQGLPQRKGQHTTISTQGGN
jgi:hypothetical protein